MNLPDTSFEADDIGTFAPFGQFDEAVDSAEAIGVDSGASLVKLCLRRPGGELYFATWPSPSRERVLALLDRVAPERIGVTGCGSVGLLASLDREVANPLEFDAWGRGANHGAPRRRGPRRARWGDGSRWWDRPGPRAHAHRLP
jgi:hypothetical protein